MSTCTFISIHSFITRARKIQKRENSCDCFRKQRTTRGGRQKSANDDNEDINETISLTASKASSSLQFPTRTSVFVYCVKRDISNETKVKVGKF